MERKGRARRRDGCGAELRVLILLATFEARLLRGVAATAFSIGPPVTPTLFSPLPRCLLLSALMPLLFSRVRGCFLAFRAALFRIEIADALAPPPPLPPLPAVPALTDPFDVRLHYLRVALAHRRRAAGHGRRELLLRVNRTTVFQDSFRLISAVRRSRTRVGERCTVTWNVDRGSSPLVAALRAWRCSPKSDFCPPALFVPFSLLLGVGVLPVCLPQSAAYAMLLACSPLAHFRHLADSHLVSGHPLSRASGRRCYVILANFTLPSLFPLSASLASPPSRADRLLSSRPTDQMRPQDLMEPFCVQFVSEEAVDLGGVAREWFSLIAREMVNPNYVCARGLGNASLRPRTEINGLLTRSLGHLSHRTHC